MGKKNNNLITNFDQQNLIIAMAIYKKSGDYAKEIRNWTVDEWMLYGTEYIPNEFKHLPNVKMAIDIQNSPLFGAMSEEGQDEEE